MREIKFKAIKANTDIWVYGTLVYINDEEYIFNVNPKDDNFTKVKAKTIGQFTGIYDSDGHEIYEGDIVRYHEESILLPSDGKLEGAKKSVITWVGDIYFWSGAFCMHFTDHEKRDSYMIIGMQKNATIEIIGNIHSPLIIPCQEYLCTYRASGLCDAKDYSKCFENLPSLNEKVLKELNHFLTEGE